MNFITKLPEPEWFRKQNNDFQVEKQKEHLHALKYIFLKSFTLGDVPFVLSLFCFRNHSGSGSFVIKFTLFLI